MSQDIRNSILGAKKNFRSVEFEYDGQKIRFREPSVKEISDIQAKSLKADGEIDFVKYTVNTIIHQCEDPKDGKAIFAQADRDALMDMPMNSGFIKAALAAQGELNKEVDAEDGPLVD